MPSYYPRMEEGYDACSAARWKCSEYFHPCSRLLKNTRQVIGHLRGYLLTILERWPPISRAIIRTCLKFMPWTPFISSGRTNSAITYSYLPMALLLRSILGWSTSPLTPVGSVNLTNRRDQNTNIFFRTQLHERTRTTTTLRLFYLVSEVKISQLQRLSSAAW